MGLSSNFLLELALLLAEPPSMLDEAGALRCASDDMSPARLSLAGLPVACTVLVRFLTWYGLDNS